MPSVTSATFASPVAIQDARGRQLATMFTETVAALDIPTRRALAEIVENCHTRRTLLPDARSQPVLFYHKRDEHVQAIAGPHLASLGAPILKSNLRNPLPFADSPGLSESVLVPRMDEETRREYILLRFYGHRKECADLGYRYLHHLARPDLPLSETLRLSPQMDIDDRRHIVAANEDSEEDFSDDDDIAYSDEEDSCCSDMSDVTRESDLLRSATYESSIEASSPNTPSARTPVSEK